MASFAIAPLLRRLQESGLMTPAEKGMGFRCFPIGPVFDHCQLSFRQSRFLHTARVLPSSASLICQASMAFPICCFPPRLSAQGRLDDPGTFLLVPPGCTGDTVMRDMAHNPQRAAPALSAVAGAGCNGWRKLQSPPGSSGSFAPRAHPRIGIAPYSFNPQRAAAALSLQSHFSPDQL